MSNVPSVTPQLENHSFSNEKDINISNAISHEDLIFNNYMKRQNR
jgi:hypothetical protein